MQEDRFAVKQVACYFSLRRYPSAGGWKECYISLQNVDPLLAILLRLRCATDLHILRGAIYLLMLFFLLSNC